MDSSFYRNKKSSQDKKLSPSKKLSPGKNSGRKIPKRLIRQKGDKLSPLKEYMKRKTRK